MTWNRGVLAMCAAQASAQIGAFSVAALLPTLIPAWSLTNTEAGWIGGIYYAAYTLVVPVLASLADRGKPWLLLAGAILGLVASQNLLVLNQYYTQATRVCGGRTSATTRSANAMRSKRSSELSARSSACSTRSSSISLRGIVGTPSV